MAAEKEVAGRMHYHTDWKENQKNRDGEVEAEGESMLSSPPAKTANIVLPSYVSRSCLLPVVTAAEWLNA
jgi:hypothetical protein